MVKLPLMIIVPAMNEELSIGHVVRSLKRVLPDTPVLVIDDHSSDSTAQTAFDAGAGVVRLPKHLGLAGCLRTGYRIALERGFENVVRVDGDGQHEPADIPGILRALNETGADIVIGSRFLAPGRWRSTLFRSAGIALLRRVTSRAIGKKIHDPTSGFIGVNRRTLELFANSQPPPYPEVGALIALRRVRCHIHEVPCRMYPRRAGKSSMTFLTSLRYLGGVVAGLLRNSIIVDSLRSDIPDVSSGRHGFESK